MSRFWIFIPHVIKIAKAQGGPNSAKQVAYLWAKNVGGETAVKLLSKLSLLSAAVEFAAENGHMEFAYELARASQDKSILQTVFLKQALALEDEGKFPEAEAAFLQANKPREAILMYVHNEDWDGALRIAEKHDTSSVTEILVGQAKFAFGRKDFTKAESLALRAQKPDLILKMYREALLWKEAMRFCKEYVPGKLAELNEEYDRHVVAKTSSTGKEEYASAARMFEQQREYTKAIDMYLKLTTETSSNASALEDAWGRAVELAIKFVPGRCDEVVRIVCERLVQMQRYEQAARLYNSIDAKRDAVDVYLRADLWEQARQLASSDRQLNEYVEAAYVRNLKSKGQADALASVDVLSALDMFASRNEWDKCLEKAQATKNREIVDKYLMMLVSSLVRERKFDEAVRQLSRYGICPDPQYFDMYDRIAKGVLRKASKDSLHLIREVLFKLVRYCSDTFPSPWSRPITQIWSSPTPAPGIPIFLSLIYWHCGIIAQLRRSLLHLSANRHYRFCVIPTFWLRM